MFLYFLSFSEAQTFPPFLALCPLCRKLLFYTGKKSNLITYEFRGANIQCFPQYLYYWGSFFCKNSLTLEHVIQLSVSKVIYILISLLLNECCKPIRRWRSVMAFDQEEDTEVISISWFSSTMAGRPQNCRKYRNMMFSWQERPEFMFAEENGFLDKFKSWFTNNAAILKENSFFFFTLQRSLLINSSY